MLLNSNTRISVLGTIDKYTHGTIGVSWLINYLLTGSTFTFTTNPSGNMILDNQGTGGDTYDALSYAGRALQLDATNELKIPIFNTLGADTKQTAVLGVGWTANGSHSYTGATASSTLSDLSTVISAPSVLIDFTITAFTSGTVGGKNALGTYTVESTSESLTGVSFVGTVLINSVKQISNPNSYICYHNIDMNVVTQIDCSTLIASQVYSFTNKTINNILTTHTAFSVNDLSALQANPNLLAKLALNGSAPELSAVLVGDEGYYACSEPTLANVYDAKHPIQFSTISNYVETIRTNVSLNQRGLQTTCLVLDNVGIPTTYTDTLLKHNAGQQFLFPLTTTPVLYTTTKDIKAINGNKMTIIVKHSDDTITVLH